MQKTIIINLCSEYRFDEVDFLAYPLMHSNSYQMLDATILSENSIKNVAEEISVELKAAKFPRWHLICLTSDRIDVSSNYKRSIIAWLKLINKVLIPEFRDKPDSLTLFYIRSESYVKYNYFDMDGNFLGSKSDPMYQYIENEWKRVISFDKRHEIIKNNGFEGINNSDYKNLILEVKKNITDSLYERFIKDFRETEHEIKYDNFEISLEEIETTYNKYLLSFDELIQKPDNYDSFKPVEDLLKLLREEHSIFSEKFSKFGIVVYDYESCDNTNEELQKICEIQLLLLLLAENKKIIGNTQAKAIKLEFDSAGFAKSCIEMNYAINKAIEETEHKFSNKSHELKLLPENGVFSSKFGNLSRKKAEMPKIDLFYNQFHLNLWNDFVEKQTEIITDYKSQSDKQISQLYFDMNKQNTESVITSIDNIFDELAKRNNDYAKFTQSIKPPQSRDIISEWNKFIDNENAIVAESLNRKPSKKAAFYTAAAGIVALSACLLFFHNLLWLIWLFVFIVVIIVVFYSALQIIAKPVKQSALKVSTKLESLLNEVIAQRDKYASFLANIKSQQARRKNLNLLQKAADQKNELFLRYQCHEQQLQAIKRRLDNMITAFGYKRDDRYTITESTNIEYSEPCFKSKVYHITNYGKSESMIKAGNNEFQSKYSSIVKALLKSDIELKNKGI